MNFFSKELWEHEFVDLWSIPHTLFGVVIAFGVAAFNKSTRDGWMFVTVGALLWELFEIVGRITEHTSNQIIDVVIALIGFGITMTIINHAPPKNIRRSFYIVLGIFIVTSIIGWLAWSIYS